MARQNPSCRTILSDLTDTLESMGTQHPWCELRARPARTQVSEDHGDDEIG